MCPDTSEVLTDSLEHVGHAILQTPCICGHVNLYIQDKKNIGGTSKALSTTNKDK